MVSGHCKAGAICILFRLRSAAREPLGKCVPKHFQPFFRGFVPISFLDAGHVEKPSRSRPTFRSHKRAFMNENKQYYTIGAVAKACKVLDTLASKNDWELAELSRAVGMPKTTVHRILLTFEDAGYVMQDEKRGSYRISHKLFCLGSKFLDGTSIPDVARPFCRTLLEKFDETVNVCVASGTDMVIVDKNVTSQALRPDLIVGVSFPIFYSASGKAYLAFSDQSAYPALLERIRRETVPTVSDKAFENFLAELEDVRRRGLAYDYEELFPGVRCIAVPIFDRTDRAVAALSVTAPTVRLTKRVSAELEGALLEAGNNVSRRLGATRSIP